ncbi:MAG: hypothetical protein H6604_01495 [Flavobacteriales bacterium]|nr:hypothetical protein [Flavobacteriales bacterium]
MKLKILFISVFCSTIVFAQTSVKGDDSQEQIDALRKQNALLKQQLIAMLNPSQASLNQEFINGVNESNKILKEHFQPSMPVLNTSMLAQTPSKFQAQSELGKFIRGTQDLNKAINYHAYITGNKLYVSTNPERIFDGDKLSQGGTKLVSSLAEIMKDNKDYVLNVQRCEIKNTDSKKEANENKRLDALVSSLKTKVADFDNRVSVSQVSSIDLKHKKQVEINVDEYNFILSY